jgi:exosortase
LETSAAPTSHLAVAGKTRSSMPITKEPSRNRAMLSQTAWVQIVAIAICLIVTFWPNFRRLWGKTNPFDGEANWGHAIFIPIIGLYYLYLNREELLKAKLAPLLPLPVSRNRMMFVASGLLCAAMSYVVGPIALPSQAANLHFLGMFVLVYSVLVLALGFGFGTLMAGLGLAAFGIHPGHNDFIWDFGMVLTLFGVTLALTGWDVIKIAWFPIAFLVCGLPWPGLVYSWIAGPLQRLAANVAVATLNLTGVVSEQSGTKIFIGDGLTQPVRTLNVAEACAGMRSLMTFISVAAAIAFLSGRPLWQKIIITISAIPIAIFCNVMRVSGQGLLDTYVSHELSENFAHQFVGMIMLVPAFFLILLVGWVLDQLFVEEVDQPEVLKR